MPDSDPPPLVLFDTCALINLALHPPVAAMFKDRFSGRAGWARAISGELVNLGSLRPPPVRARQTNAWASSWLLDPPLDVATGEKAAVEALQLEIGGGHLDTPTQHLGEAVSIVILQHHDRATFITDDTSARSAAQTRRVRAVSTLAVLAKAIKADVDVIDDYLDALRRGDRFHGDQKAGDVAAGDLGSLG